MKRGRMAMNGCLCVLPGYRYCPGCKRIVLQAEFLSRGYCQLCSPVKNANYRGTSHGRRVRRQHTLRYRYGLTIEQYEQRWHSQGGSCAICGRHASTLKRGLNVDHNHTTGQVRDLLCSSCNRLIGFCYENTGTLRSAIDYLERWSQPHILAA